MLTMSQAIFHFVFPTTIFDRNWFILYFHPHSPRSPSSAQCGCLVSVWGFLVRFLIFDLLFFLSGCSESYQRDRTFFQSISLWSIIGYVSTRWFNNCRIEEKKIDCRFLTVFYYLNMSFLLLSFYLFSPFLLDFFFLFLRKSLL